jgi:AraC-like DNA-binding protein
MQKDIVFQTFKPKDFGLQKYVDYYYLDIKTNNVVAEYDCFPHFNNTISLYKSHILLKDAEMKFDETALPCQIFTPIREKVLSVKQIGKVHRIVIVFKPFGINQFFRDLDFSQVICDISFFSQNEIEALFNTTDLGDLTTVLDQSLSSRFLRDSNEIVKKSIDAIFDNSDNFSVEDFSDELGISRKHMNRVFKQKMGVSVKKFQQIVNFRKTIAIKLQTKPNDNFTQIAYNCNFADQSHFNKVYKNFTENSPKEFFQKGVLIGNEDTFWRLKN